MDNDAGVLPQLPGELIGADINRINLRRPTREQDVGKSAGRATDVQRHCTRYVEPEMREAMIELDPAARNPGVILAPYFQRCIIGEHVASLGQFPLTGKHGPGHDQRLGSRPAFRKSAGDQQLVRADLAHRCKTCGANTETPIRRAATMAASTAPDAMSFACRTWSFRSTVRASPSLPAISALRKKVRRDCKDDPAHSHAQVHGKARLIPAEQMPRIQPSRSATRSSFADKRVSQFRAG